MSRPALKIELATTASRVAAALRAELLDGLYAPGTSLRDVDLATRTGVSRPTVREALAELARDGLVVHALNRGMEVASLDLEDVCDIYATRRVIERAGVVALTGRGERRVAELEAAVIRMGAAEHAGDRRATVEADVAFHAALVAVTGVQRLQRAHHAAMLELRLVLSVTDRAYADDDGQLESHQRLLAALRDGSARAGAQELERHLVEAQERVCSVLEASA